MYMTREYRDNSPHILAFSSGIQALFLYTVNAKITVGAANLQENTQPRTYKKLISDQI